MGFGIEKGGMLVMKKCKHAKSTNQASSIKLTNEREIQRINVEKGYIKDMIGDIEREYAGDCEEDIKTEAARKKQFLSHKL